MKILAFAASNSKKSINKKLVTYAANLAKDSQIEILDLNEYELPLFSEEREVELGQPELAQNFLNKIQETDVIIISFAEHNGSYSVAYKNLFDWCSRINKKLFQNKSLILLATSPGARGAKTVLEIATNTAPFFGGHVKASISVPNFYENFDIKNNTIINPEIREQLTSAIKLL